MKKFSFIFLVLILSGGLQAQDEEISLEDTTGLADKILESAYKSYVDSITGTFDKKTGKVVIADGLAEIKVPDGYYFIGKEDSKRLLVDLWGNPPESVEGVLGALSKAGVNSITEPDSWLVTVSYEETGYIKDEDAESINYDELLSEMKSETSAANTQRQEMGYGTMELVGWAVPPFYDKKAKKLHWAKELNFGNSPDNTLNYDIRILGRKGVLVLTAVSDMNILEEVKQDMPEILEAVNFEQGNRYADFDPSVDKVAAYGIAGLVAGKVLSKVGFFALIAKFWKFIAVGGVAALAFIRRLFFRKKEDSEENA